MADGIGLGEWVKDNDRKLDELIVMVREMNVTLKHVEKRMDTQCSEIEALEQRVDVLESHKQKVDGELTMLR